MTCTYEEVHARFYDSDKYLGTTDMDIHNGYPTMRVPDTYSDQGLISEDPTRSPTWRPKRRIGIGIVG